MTDPDPEQVEAIRRWLETDSGKRLLEISRRIDKLRQEKKSTLTEFAQWIKSPDVDKDASFKLIGEFVVRFSQLETLLRVVLSAEARVQSDLRDAFVMALDFALLVSVLKNFYEKKLSGNAALRGRVNSALNQCLAVNNERVRVAHGMWILDEAGMAKLMHFRRGALASDTHYGDAAKIGASIALAEKAFDSLLSAMHDVADYEPDPDDNDET